MLPHVLPVFRRLVQPVLLPAWWQDALLLLPRAIGGYLLATSFGAVKFGLPWSPPENNLGFFEVAYWFPNDVAVFGGVFAIFPAFFAWIAAFSEAVGGLLLVLGLQTRLAAFLNMCTLLVAAFWQQAGQGLWNMLPAIGFIWACLPALVLGSGRFGLDYLLTGWLGSGGQRPARMGLLLVLAIGLPSCVQQATPKTVVYLLRVPDGGKTVGLRGRDNPLDWERDTLLQPTGPDSLYRLVITTVTGYAYTEVKFTRDGQYELPGQPNRQVWFARGDTTVYRATFNVAPTP
ncbi:DoxX family protein [Hymenobacter sediminis]|uniref:DoxX family protein n=1 Tax=Hymenobacter sediminis TaxID=2218621 RepID=UPI000DA66D5E|nr:DoxX family protein [Hymenobacter sediminis]RPD44099.1 DoxX family protein [Hymenobacter sediminis]